VTSRAPREPDEPALPTTRRRDDRERLLAETLAYAVESIPFYGRLGPPPPTSLEDFPLVDALLLAEREEEFVRFDRFPDAILFTGGTTRTPSVVYRSGREYETWIRHATGLAPGDTVPPEDLVDGFAINLWTPAHGMPLLPAYGFPVANVPLDYPPHAWYVLRLIERGLPVAGQRLPATRLLSSYQQLLMLTDFLWSNGLDLRDCSLELVESSSFHMPPSVAARLADFWGAEVATAFGLTEFEQAPMEPCPSCGGYHVPDTVYSELLAPDRSARVTRGAGVLVLTSLLPFVSLQPRIRYWTNDLFELLPPCERVGEPGLRFRGRADRCVIVREDGAFRAVLTPLEIVDCLADLPHVRRDDGWYRGFLRGGTPRADSPFRPGWILFGLERQPGAVAVTVEADFDPAADASLARDLRDRFLAALRRRSPRLDADLEAHELELRVELVEPGGLAARGTPLART
jgi:hypothetical protein